MVTRRCNMACGHCSVESNPRLANGPAEDILRRRVRDAAASGIRSILLTGGEPMLRQPLVLGLVQEARRLGLVSALTSNGFWGSSVQRADACVSSLKAAGLATLNLSFDRYHQAFQGPEPLLNIARAAHRHNLRTAIVFTHTRDDDELEQLVAPFRDLKGVTFRFYDVQPVGQARHLERATLSGRLEGFCQACRYPAISDDGRMTACNGPSYFQPEGSPLIVGSLERESMATLLERHDQDALLETIRTAGPAALIDELREFPAFEPKASYAGNCDACTHICSQPEAVAWLRQRLEQPERQAERVAAALVIRNARRGGTLFRESVNSLGVARALIGRLQGRPDPREGSIFGRADLDWIRVCKVILESGLALPMLEALQTVLPPVPRFVLSQLEEHGLKSALRSHLFKRTLESLNQELEALGSRGVLLKGAAQSLAGGRRTTGDIDLWVDPPGAARLHRQLLERGAIARGAPARHHLQPLEVQGVLVEIHTRIMPEFWGLPEGEMLAERLPTSFSALDRLSPEGFLLHAAVHFTKHGFDQGLKTAYDLWWAWQQGLDESRLQRWLQAVRLPLAGRAPLQFFSQHLALPIPWQPRSDLRMRLLQRWIAARFFQLHSPSSERNPFLRVPLYLMLHPCPGSLATSLTMLLRRPLAAPPQNFSWREQLGEALDTARRAWRMG